MITQEHIIAWLEESARIIAENKDYLTDLDSAIGDADHGINMNRGFQHVVTQLPDVATKDIGSILKTVGMALISKVGGAGGPLYGTFFLHAASTATGKHTLGDNDAIQLLDAGLGGVKQRGKAQPGDKTMVDAWQPAVEAFKHAVEEGKTTLPALEEAVDAAREGMEATIPLVARKGRASYLGERSEGHQDPGATSTYLLLKALLDTMRNT